MKSDIEHIREFIASNFQLSLGTYDEDPWCATLYYAADDALNIYVLTAPATIHATHIKNNPKVSVIIADSPQDPASNKKGLQMYGECILLSSDEDVKKAIDLWVDKLKVPDPNYSLEGIKENRISGRMYRITPKKIKFFNEDLQEEGKEKILTL